ncbi:MAG TPA: thiamine-phosphate kinase [Gordonia sp. (in: high G+C Gram-positive bacteria)]|uniref:thiamine-phosphate kinase n=1 Tax=unclassified Gordonia (in: high G+C Gram-positive bacteria) TaxID=2657482 RepID=UPI0025C4DE6E|nr:MULTISPECIES: thiamine-phosphate kinase [unclassified Gordonia (in: high G+C Gram-positive bacteria)]HNP57330.1 thiamine-phosphate kinase [Gordonia sp. (in: high G+C Gram-positive bacteria)]HRC50876.1 thiamine-phosphate kinase [Gordonia sp. (in: high G+C Gram-positive bacteria)]
MTSRPTVADVGERALLTQFARAAGTPGSVVGPGDDAAVVDPGATVLSVDTAVAGRHFRLDWSTPEQIGARAVIAAAADIAAMGARTTGVLVALAAPSTTPADVVVGINRGVVGCAAALGASVLGGDLVEASDVSVSITAVGVLDGREPVRVSGARPGDVLAVSGPLGASAAGYAVLASGVDLLNDPAACEVVSAFRCPAPDLGQGPVAARAGAHALTDVSDGLVVELAVLCSASGVGVDVDSGAVPVTDAVRAVAVALRADPRPWALGGGEDHELLGAFAGPDAVPRGWTVIGRVVPDRAEPVLIDGEPPRVQGWQSV